MVSITKEAITVRSLTQTAAPGTLYGNRVGQTLYFAAANSWTLDGTTIAGQTTPWLYITPAMLYKSVKPGNGAAIFILPADSALPQSSNIAPIDNPTISYGLQGVYDYMQGVPFVDWMKISRPPQVTARMTTSSILTGTMTALSVTSIPAGLAQTGTFDLIYDGFSYISVKFTSWTGTTFAIQSTNFPHSVAAGYSLSTTSTVAELTSAGYLNAAGWPIAVPSYDDLTIYFATRPDTGLALTLTWDGTGTINFFGFINVTRPTANSAKFQVPSGNQNCAIFIHATNAAPNNVRNLQLVPDALIGNLAAGEVFTPDFLNFHAVAKGVRFMDWLNTNNSAIVNWADRKPLSQISWSDEVPLEVCISAANAIWAKKVAAGKTAGGFEAWFNIPHQATNTYITNAATLLWTTLDPAITCHVEYSNENWNLGTFSQGHYTNAKGIADWPTETFPYSDWYGKRATEIFYLFGQVFASNMSRLKRVLATQTVSTSVSTAVVTSPMWLAHENYYSASLGRTLGAPYTYADKLAITCYWGGYIGGGGDAAYVTAWNTSPTTGHQYMFGRLADPNTQYSMPDILADWKAQKVVADTYGLSLCFYEGGSSLVQSANPNFGTTEFTAALAFTRSAQGAEIYRHMMQMWKQFGTGNPFMQFCSAAGERSSGAWRIADDYTAAALLPAGQVMIALNGT